MALFFLFTVPPFTAAPGRHHHCNHYSPQPPLPPRIIAVALADRPRPGRDCKAMSRILASPISPDWPCFWSILECGSWAKRRGGCGKLGVVVDDSFTCSLIATYDSLAGWELPSRFSLLLAKSNVYWAVLSLRNAGGIRVSKVRIYFDIFEDH